ncbi:hypothetical protein DFJ77DRAFT_424909 [Powellomyces hirtus]|nr:hypothetical protein DFJ77DRAFT_424909 [Powellomyces hirtus]
MWAAHLASVACLLILLSGLVSFWYQRIAQKKQHARSQLRGGKSGKIVGFFHPFCDAGGGGERVLWAAVNAIQEKWPNSVCVIYAWGQSSNGSQILSKVKDQFDIDIREDAMVFKKLTLWRWLEASSYPIATLLGQSLGSLIVGCEALELLTPDVFIDTVGFAFTYPIAAHLYDCKVVAYVHYPTISSDMLGKLSTRKADFNHSGIVARSWMLTAVKKCYYVAFSWLYGMVGRVADVVMVNSSWTSSHIKEIWRVPDRTCTVYPPCNTDSFRSFSLIGRERKIVSVAQFRPEKAHGLQLQAFHELLADHPRFRSGDERCALILIGGSRNAEDQGRVEALRRQARELKIEDNVEIIENASYAKLHEVLRSSAVGVHTMRDEHFGIGVVEYMAAGLIAVAHDSGGPKLDIVTDKGGQPTGYLASTSQEYACALYAALQLSPEEQLQLRERARKAVAGRFSDSAFSKQFVEQLVGVMN